MNDDNMERPEEPSDSASIIHVMEAEVRSDLDHETEKECMIPEITSISNELERSEGVNALNSPIVETDKRYNEFAIDSSNEQDSDKKVKIANAGDHDILSDKISIADEDDIANKPAVYNLPKDKLTTIFQHNDDTSKYDNDDIPSTSLDDNIYSDNLRERHIATPVIFAEPPAIHPSRTDKYGEYTQKSMVVDKTCSMLDKNEHDVQTQEPTTLGGCDYILWAISIFVIIVTFPLSIFLTIKMVQEYERAVIFRLGRLLGTGAKGPGIFFVVPCIDSYTKIDLRTVSFDVPPQEILTKDSVTVAVDAVVYYRISNATISVINVEDANRSTRLLAQTTLRNVLGTKSLSEILSDRDQISVIMQESLDTATDPWGVKVERVEVKDVRLPVQLQRAMAAEAEAAREARAKVIAAEGELNASRALKEASEVMAESPAALQLRYLQTLNAISAEKNSTIIFPLPIDILANFMKK